MEQTTTMMMIMIPALTSYSSAVKEWEAKDIEICPTVGIVYQAIAVRVAKVVRRAKAKAEKEDRKEQHR
jgi:hypothetical protein